MTYLTRRIEHLLQRFNDGKITFVEPFASSKDGQIIREDIIKVKRFENGLVDLSTCSTHVKSFAKSIFAIDNYNSAHQETSFDEDPIDLKKVSTVTKEYFQLLENFFIDATGIIPKDFEFEEYRAGVLKNPNHSASKSEKAFAEYPSRIMDFLSKNHNLLYKASKEIGGIKCVTSGSSNFTQSTFDGIRKFALYADTIFIPDPVLPWLEVQRDEERYTIINLLLNCHQLLLLKPLVDAQLSCPSIIVFPSWEKLLERNDFETMDGISQLILDFFSHNLNATFEDETEIVNYIQTSGKDIFQETVTNNGLFWPPEASGPMSFSDGYNAYNGWLHSWRSEEWLESASILSPELLVFNGIVERLAPQFHARDNSSFLEAIPLYCLSPNFYYYRLLSEASNTILKHEGIIGHQSHSTLQGLLDPKISWLGNIPIESIAKLREENANADFRNRINTYVNELTNSQTDNLDRVTLDVMLGLRSLLDEHDREAKKISEELERNLLITLGGSVITFAASLYPWLEPWFGLTLLGPTAKAGLDIMGYIREKKMLSKSLLGVLSEASSN